MQLARLLHACARVYTLPQIALNSHLASVRIYAILSHVFALNLLIANFLAIKHITCPDDGTADMSVSKTDAARCVGSNPTPGTIKITALDTHKCRGLFDNKPKSIINN